MISSMNYIKSFIGHSLAVFSLHLEFKNLSAIKKMLMETFRGKKPLKYHENVFTFAEVFFLDVSGQVYCKCVIERLFFAFLLCVRGHLII